MHIGIIGAGPAGVALANLLAGHVAVTVINPESPYDRPPLSKELFGEPYEPLELEENVSFYQGEARVRRQGAGFRIFLDVSAGGVIPSSRGKDSVGSEAATADAIDVDVIVLATGTRPRHLIPHALTLTTLADARALAAHLRASGRCHIIGGGWIGCEVASVAREEGIDVELWEAAPTLLARSFGSWQGSPWPEMLTSAGVRLHLGERYPHAQAEGVILLEATGTTPETSIARALGCALSARGAVLTKLDMRAQLLPGSEIHDGGAIYAIGDCADIALADERIYHGGHWCKAVADAQRCASAILGEPAPKFLEAPEVFSTQFGHEIALVGEVPSDPAGVRIEESDGLWRWYEGETLLAQLSFDQPRAVGKARKALRLPTVELTLGN